VSFGADEWNLAASARWLGADRILWASHYPHPEYSDNVLETLMHALTPLDEDERRKILCHNEVDAYGLPVTAAV
jgi:predicted TIM-barrel fold metal-dependent hydrolase